MLEIYLIRHAESELNADGTLIGGRSNESPITNLGIEQAQRLGGRLQKSGITFDKIYTSIAVRAKETARISCEFIGHNVTRVVNDVRLCELDQGEWEQQPIREIYTLNQLDEIKQNSWFFRPPLGETKSEVAQRMNAYIEGIVKQNTKQGRVAIFGHGMAIKCYLTEFMGWDRQFTYNSCIDNTSISRVRFLDDGTPQFVSFNDAAHLEGLSQQHL